MRMIKQLAIAAWESSVQQWSWRSFLVTLVLNQAIGPLIGLLLWTAVMPDSSAVRGYFFAVLAVQLLTVSYEDHTFSNSIYDGTIVDGLLRPRPVIMNAAGANLGLRFWHGIFGLPVLLLVAITAGLPLRLGDVVLAVPALIIAGVLRFLFTITLALTAFWTDRASALVSFGDTGIALLGGIAAPLFLLPGPIAEAGRWLPFWSMLGLPGEIAAGVLTGPQLVAGYAVQAGWLLVLIVVTALVWRRGLRVFTAVGA
ncbi:ABC-2 family transporter protein [Microlunatus parietis]|uniref:ABC-2 type transport system permease protein n=1 Tax=Microlunatus parietis TaxID=682979 RepID=A0A7Y9IBC9_9ACTN|nr:ABC-2 family transporter protein [Microlunatus parietis]NYE73174.1 ABC-2 type transport system permease protein [Microlunatus parietis]